MLIGSIGAINQTKLKRLIAYSSISHVGFMLLGLVPLSFASLRASFAYNLIYICMGILTFALAMIIFNKTNYISELSGLSRRNPVLALTFSITLFSIAGIPPLAGFFSKYLVLVETIGNGYFFIAIIAVLASSVAIFYYIRIVK